MDKSHWYSNKCPQYDCRKKSCSKCKCGLNYVNIPITMGDNSEGSAVAPKNGAYCNAIVKYEANGAVYIYSAEGVPTLLTTDISSSIATRLYNLESEVTRLRNRITEISADMPQPNLVVSLPNDITTYPAGEEPISLESVMNALENGRSVFFIYRGDALERIYTVTAIESNDSIWNMRVESIGVDPAESAGFWVVRSNSAGGWTSVAFVPLVQEQNEESEGGLL